jgi:hypothetical protein
LPQSGILTCFPLMFYSRFVFRFCDVTCNHIARLADSGGGLDRDHERERLDQLNHERAALQVRLLEISRPYIEVCAGCKGRCCHGPRERDTFIDRVVQDPATPHRAARRRGSRRECEAECTVITAEAERAPGCCPQLTVQGCDLAGKTRPIQCVTYFCWAMARALSPAERAESAAAVLRLMGIEVETTRLALGARVRGAGCGRRP